ncbi:hypothetical protein EST38_g11772 [Candolleomyces aberdarensis]|uniref:Uncharacterized protein n=1 Tax=Candolleomyces aberdarensis TaxID=2316362 RepID=A0A4Q2D421_9AGAR|nr:hypothetical protein EST38_g11772 [Candolleomyces aberdarensis]
MDFDRCWSFSDVGCNNFRSSLVSSGLCAVWSKSYNWHVPIVAFPHAPSPIPALIGCFAIRAHNVLFSIVYALILTSELIILAITFWIGCRNYAGLKSRLVLMFYRDGLGYFVCVTVIAAGNIICNLVAPPGYTYLLALESPTLSCQREWFFTCAD